MALLELCQEFSVQIGSASCHDADLPVLDMTHTKAMNEFQSVLKKPEIFVGEVNEEFICQICRGVLSKSRQCKRGHVFCHGCIMTWLENRHTCPTCGVSLTRDSLGMNRCLDNIIDRSKVRCIHEECQWTGSRGTIITHLEKECDFQPQRCRNYDKGCTQMILRTDNHSCPADCRHCDEAFQVTEMASHVKECNKAPVSCPHDGCSKIMLRENIRSHDLVCPHALVECPFAVHGCDINGTGQTCRMDMDRHQVEAAMSHSLLVSHRVAFMSKKLKKLEAEVATQLVYLERALHDMECHDSCPFYRLSAKFRQPAKHA